MSVITLTGIVRAVCISEKKGEQKHPIDCAEFIVNHGIKGDAHAGNWHRQVSLLAKESVSTMNEKLDFELKPGDFAENVLIEGIKLSSLEIGTKIRIGEALCELTQIGKECHSNCAIRELAGDCIMPREGVFVKVIEPGLVKAGDAVEVVVNA